MAQTLYQVDSFTPQPFKGNPAGVCLLEGPAPESWMQDIAAEMNLSETSFVWPEEGAFRLRWFTPTREMYLCGHATLAAAHVMFETGVVAGDGTARFDTLSGPLSVVRQGGWLEMDFPVWTAEAQPPPAGLAQALGCPVEWFGRNDHFGMALLSSPRQVADLKPDIRLVAALPMDGVIVTAQGDGNPYDLVCRVFGPNLGINEDPVTGGAHCMLTPFWAARLGRQTLRSYQASSRGGELRVTLKGDRVAIAGQAVTVFKLEVLG